MEIDDAVKNVRRDQVLTGASDQVIGFSLAHSFLENGLENENPESWVLRVLSETSKDNSGNNGVEKGRVKLLNPYLVKDSFICSDFVDSALSKNYSHDIGSEEDLGYSNNQYGIILNTMNAVYTDDIWQQTNPDGGRANRYKLNISINDFTRLYDSLSRLIFPSDDLVEKETGVPVDQIGTQEHVETFPYAHNNHTQSQLDTGKDRVVNERERYFRDSIVVSD